MQIKMLASRFAAGGVLSYVAGSTYEVANDLALQFIGDNAAVEVNGSRTAATGTQRDEFNRGAEGQAGVSLVSAPWNAVSRIAGLSAASVSTATSDRGLKVEAEADFSRVRLRLYSEGGAATTFKALAAVTETAATDTAANLSQPVVGGTTYNALRASDGAPGWATLTVDGASTFDWPGVASADNPKELVTDWVNLRSVPRADGGTRPLVMFRIEHDGTANGDWAGHNHPDWVSEASGESWYRLWQPYTISGGGGVTDPTKTASAVSASAVWAAVEFDYDTPAHTVLGIGDSQLENSNGEALGTFGVWAWQACASLSSPGRPVHYFNAGRGGGTPTVYLPPGLLNIASLKPKVVLYQPISSNSGAPTAARNAAATGQIAQVRKACADVGARLVLVTGIPFSSSATANAAAEALRLEVSSYCASLAARGLCEHLDFEAVLGTGASPNRIKAEFGADAGPVHPNPAGQAAMAAHAITVLSRILPG